MTTLHRIIYCSSANSLQQEDIQDILTCCERNNPPKNITGMLLFNSGYFLQLLEGPRKMISSTFVRIAGDERHGNIEIVSSSAITFRLFPEWSMHYVPSRGHASKIQKRFVVSDAFDPRQMSATAIEQFCIDQAAASAMLEADSAQQIALSG